MTPPNLSQAVDTFNANDLANILQSWGLSELPKTKEGKIGLWLREVGNPARINRMLAALPSRARRGLELLQRSGDELRTQRFKELLTRESIADESKTPASQRSYYDTRTIFTPDPITAGDIVARLLRDGLIWTHTIPTGMPGNTRLSFDGGQFVYIPHEVAAHLPPPSPKEQKPLPTITGTLNGSARTFQRDVYLIWSSAREAPLNTTNADLLRMPDLKRLGGKLLIPETIATGTRESDYRRVLFLRKLLQALDLLTVHASGAISGVADPKFFTSAAADRVKQSFLSWRDGSWWNELWAIYDPSVTRATGAVTDYAQPRVGEARRKVLEAFVTLSHREEMRQITPTPWISLEMLSDYLRDHAEEFLVDRATAEQMSGAYRWSSYATLYSPYEYNQLGWTWSGFANDPNKGWNTVERSFIRAVLAEGLYWLGLADLGYRREVSSQGGAAPADPIAFRLTDMGRWLLAQGPQPIIPEETGRVVVQPNFRIFAFDPISDAVLARLDSFAVRLNADRAIEYELSRESVYRAQQAGQHITGIVDWLAEITGAALPQNVVRSLEEWQAAFERIVFYPSVGWLEAASSELADAILADPKLAGMVVKRATPTGLIVRKDKVEPLEQALLVAGELPGRSRAPADARRSSLTLDDNGAVHFLHAAPSLYAVGAIQPYSEPTEAGWRITAASVARAAAAGLEAAAIIASLAEMAIGGVPAPLQAHIKAWSRHFGSATIRTLTLLQFRDQDTLNELLQDPALARLLHPFRPEAKLGLATIEPEAAERVTALLAERGVEIAR